jgi:hypothetical protein
MNHLKEYRRSFYDIKQKDVDTVEDLEIDGMNMSVRDRLDFLYHGTKKQ